MYFSTKNYLKSTHNHTIKHETYPVSKKKKEDDEEVPDG
jgi:hypothetical protein